ncbi:MAG: SOS response-associated peptidase [Candidatus Sumerlaeia bacterium]
MCGRFANTSDLQRLISRFKFTVEVEGWETRPRFNIAPSQEALVIRCVFKECGEGRACLRVGRPMRWGLVPSWAADEKIGNRMINARSETLAGKPAFRRALAARRCLVPADGFFEWQRVARGSRRPFFVRLRGGVPFAFAGLWETWVPHRSPAPTERGQDDTPHRPDESAPATEQTAPLYTFTIITTEANDLVRPIHGRMPVILRPEDEERWLDPANRDPDALIALLRPCPAGEMEVFEVSPLVNSPANDSPAVIEPLAAGPPVQEQLF